jgi:phospholipid/cholesterol/gamma-HCH transport system substrate-binding protein
MPQRNWSEVIAGAVVLLAAAGFLGYAVAHTGRTTTSGYTLHARFSAIDGLGKGADVRLAGVKIGSVVDERLDPQTFLADVSFTVADDIKLPKDSSAMITSEGLLGGKYLSIQPGGDTQTIPPGGMVTITQSSVNIEELLGRFIFSASNLASQQSGGQGSTEKGGAPPGAQPSGGKAGGLGP